MNDIVTETGMKSLHFSQPFLVCKQGKRGRSKYSGLVTLSGHEEPLCLGSLSNRP